LLPITTATRDFGFRILDFGFAGFLRLVLVGILSGSSL
jgi:hypothetical protein